MSEVGVAILQQRSGFLKVSEREVHRCGSINQMVTCFTQKHLATWNTILRKHLPDIVLQHSKISVVDIFYCWGLRAPRKNSLEGKHSIKSIADAYPRTLLLNNLNDINCGHVRKGVMLSIIFWRFGSKLYRHCRFSNGY